MAHGSPSFLLAWIGKVDSFYRTFKGNRSEMCGLGKMTLRRLLYYQAVENIKRYSSAKPGIFSPALEPPY